MLFTIDFSRFIILSLPYFFSQNTIQRIDTKLNDFPKLKQKQNFSHIQCK